MQERLGNLIRRRLPGIAVITCGGYFDQVIVGDYYPAWAYPMRLNWLVRMWHEPRRLWRRYLIGTPKFAIESIAWRLHRGRDRSTDAARR